MHDHRETGQLTNPPPKPQNDAAGRSAQPGREFVTNRGASFELPLFLPVYQPRSPAFQLSTQDSRFGIEGLIVNAYFLYKQRHIRELLGKEKTLSEFVGFDGLIATDSGAFQGFTRPLYLSNKKIVRFQDRIGSDIVSPLDLVTPPGDNRTAATGKLQATNKRIREAQKIVEHGILAGVQQGGRFADLRDASMEAILEMGLRYVAIGSLVPFFNRNHDMRFAGRVVSRARQMMGPQDPMHIYGAGDPVELPFFVAMGASIFDSSSYGHYAQGGYYMTPYGALSDPGPLLAGEYRCECAACVAREQIQTLFDDRDALTLHNLWTIHRTIDEVRNALKTPDGLEAYLVRVLEMHTEWFPASELGPSWESLHAA